MKYISEKSLIDAINYFSGIKLKSPEQIGLFFFFKGCGFNIKASTHYKKVGDMTSDEKIKYYELLYNLGGLFDKSEKPEKRTCLFPFSISDSIKKNDYFNGGTPFKNLLSRIRDTVDNSLIDESKFLRISDESRDKFKFARNYIEILKGDSFLSGVKISITYFSIWYMRYRGFDTDNISNDDLRNSCIQKTIEELNINSYELDTIFDDDRKDVSFSDSEITAELLRSRLNFENDIPEVISGTPDFDLGGNNMIDNEYIKNISEDKGNNISKYNLYRLLKNTKQVIIHGVPGTGKSYLTKEIESYFKFAETIQFHPSMTYEQFIGGYTINENGGLEPQIGAFLKACIRAKETDGDCLFVIDEINRGNISKIFGETILTLDRGYKVNLVAPLKDLKGNKITSFEIPDNLYIIGTMNSTDRSIAFVDYAIRRRFAFVKFHPNYDVVRNNFIYSGKHNIDIYLIMKNLNDRILDVLGSQEFLLGQSYFLPKWLKDENDKYSWSDEDIKNVFNHYLIPIIEEYTFGNNTNLKKIVGSSLSSIIEDTDKFVLELINEFSLN